jgi:hypothetical protein
MSIRGTTEDADAELALEPGEDEQRFGKYVLEAELGRGGMGVVWRARDPDLGRRVALKLVKKRGSALATTRLLREAQAIARLQHPNVVGVHEVGAVGDQMYVAMELVEGASLRHWLQRGRRDLREILDVFAQAGRGLAAAHDAGLIHRDFKPDNVLVGDDGRVRVVDFGLVRLAEGEANEPRSSGSDPLSLSHPLTHAGQLVGTPRYMAPEQLFGEPIDARTDQFAFCVTLYEALARQRPFHASNFDELTNAMLAEMIQPLPATAAVPGWLERLLWRGMARSPGRRMASMHDVVAELTADRAAERRAALDGMARTDPMIAAFPPSDADAPMVERLRAVLERAWDRKSRGDLGAAAALAAQLVAETEGLAYPPLRAAALYLAGDLAHRRGDSAAARGQLLAAARAAASAGDDWQIANVWVFLIVVAIAQGRLDEAEAFAECAEVALARTGENASLRTRLDNHRGQLAAARGDLAGAATWHRAAVARDELTHGHEHPFLVVSLLSLGEVLLLAGDLPGAREAAIRAGAIAEVDKNQPVPSRARALELLAAIARTDGKPADADLLAARALAMRERLARTKP